MQSKYAFSGKMRIYMQKNARFMIKIFALLINFSNFATELINKLYDYEHVS